MQIRTFLARTVKILTWPLLVVLGLNIESAAQKAGYSSLLLDRAAAALPILQSWYAWAMEPAVFYSALILFGAVVYEWLNVWVCWADRPGSAFQKRLIMLLAPPLAAAFRRRGFNRFTMSTANEIARINHRLLQFDMPLLPDALSTDEAVNKKLAAYLVLLGEGDFDAARTFFQMTGMDHQP